MTFVCFSTAGEPSVTSFVLKQIVVDACRPRKAEFQNHHETLHLMDVPTMNQTLIYNMQQLIHVECLFLP